MNRLFHVITGFFSFILVKSAVAIVICTVCALGYMAILGADAEMSVVAL